MSLFSLCLCFSLFSTHQVTMYFVSSHGSQFLDHQLWFDYIQMSGRILAQCVGSDLIGCCTGGGVHFEISKIAYIESQAYSYLHIVGTILAIAAVIHVTSQFLTGKFSLLIGQWRFILMGQLIIAFGTASVSLGHYNE